MISSSSTTESVEMQEIIQKLYDAGYAEIIDAFLSNENKVYTKKGRLNQSGACRVLGVKPKELRELLEKCKEVVGNDFN